VAVVGKADIVVQINNQRAAAAASVEAGMVSFFCECGDCGPDEVVLSLDQHEEIRAREDLIFAAGHDASQPIGSFGRPPAPGYGAWDPMDAKPWESLLRPAWPP
jgi:hypothetical protein